uniref:Uncharacterized protein n=1 Tax=Caulobacter phage BL57 TaxID=3348355 RepID=A0AB74UM96_9VIRU
MLEHDMLRQVLEQQAVAAAPTIGLKLSFDNSEFVQPTDGTHFAEFWVQTGNTLPAEITGPRGFEKTSGLIQFTLMAPRKRAMGRSSRRPGRSRRSSTGASLSSRRMAMSTWTRCRSSRTASRSTAATTPWSGRPSGSTTATRTRPSAGCAVDAALRDCYCRES